MAAGRKKLVITAARVELYLDKLAEIMARSPAHARNGVPLWKRLERERDRLREEEAIIAAARDRLKRSRDHTAAQSA